MEKLKNVRRGMLMIADAGLKLTPGQTVEVGTLTKQMDALVETLDGLVAQEAADA